MGLHTHDKSKLKTEDLPWAYPMQPVTSAAISGLGHAPVGIVEGTWVIIMFRDDDEQYPVILGTVGGIPQKFGAVDEDPSGILLKDSTGNLNSAEATDVVTSDTGEQVQTTAPISTAPAAAITTDIPTTPPPGTSNAALASVGIKAILAACDKYGLTTREQKCSVLAIAGGESGWIPQKEGYSYSAEALQSTFASTFKGNAELAAQYARWKGSREEFFDFVYAPENNGKQLGNTQVGDGGKFYGRGFIQITGRSNYTTYGSKAGIDLLSNPELLNSDLSTSAAVACVYILDRLRPKNTSPTANPDYFYAVKKGIGHDTGNGAQKRLAYYEYFYGNKVPSSFTEEKSAAPATSSPSESQTYNSGAPSSSAAGPIGFRDPNNKYPLQSFINEPDTNRLARGISKGTVVPIKESNKVAGIPKALDQGTFDEPSSSFSAEYPFNHVYETESGHVQEFDDTPGHERIHTYHRSGTFTEVDPNGTEVHHIVGDSYTIIDRNGCIFITGEANLTVNGNINILCQSTANIEVTGDANVEVGNDANIGVAKNTNMVVGGNMKLQVDETLDIKANAINIQSASTFNIKAITLDEAATTININGTTLNETATTFNINASTYRETVGTSHYRWNGTKYMYTGADTHERHASGIDYSNSSDPSRSGANGATAATTASTAAIAANATTGLTAPADGTPLNQTLEFLVAPVAAGEEVFTFESDEDWTTPAGVAAKAALDKKYGEQTPDNNPAQDEASPVGGTNVATVASCSIISATETFTNDFRLSPNFTLGMLIDGGVNGHNKLKDQNGLTKQQIVCNLSQLCINILEPALALLPGGGAGYGKQWKINSGYRSSGNSTSTSDHPYGRAIDITILPYDSSKKQRNFDMIQKLERVLPYDQMIIEYRSDGSNWIHMSYRGINKGDTTGPGATNRKMAFTMLNDKTYKRDSSGNPSGFVLI
jgi:predicted chitinase